MKNKSKMINKIVLVFFLMFIALIVSGCEKELPPSIERDYGSLGVFGELSTKNVKPGEILFINLSKAPYYNYVYIMKDGVVAEKIAISDDYPDDKQRVISFDVKDGWVGDYTVVGFVLDIHNEWKKVSLGSFYVENNISQTKTSENFLLGFSELVECEGMLCHNRFKTRSGEVEMAGVGHNKVMSWLTDYVNQDALTKDNVTFVWKGAQFGNGRIEWMLNDKPIITTSAVSYSRNYSSENAFFEYINEDKDYGIFRLTVPSSRLIAGKNKITAEMQGEEFVMVQTEKNDDLVFSPNMNSTKVYGFSELLYCEKDCNIAYDTAWGLVSGFKVSEGASAVFYSAKIEKNNFYNTLYFRATHFGGDGFEIYLGKSKIFDIPVMTENRTIINKGYRLDYEYKGYSNGYSGTYYIWIPSSLTGERAEITISPKKNSWIFIENIPEDMYVKQGDGQSVITSEIISFGSCEMCNLSYPSFDGNVPQYWSKSGGKLSWNMSYLPKSKAFATFIWKGAHYGKIKVVWYVNNRKVLVNEMFDDSSNYAYGLNSLRFEKTGYYAGNQGVYYLRVPSEYLSDSHNIITAEIYGSGWLMVRP